MSFLVLHELFFHISDFGANATRHFVGIIPPVFNTYLTPFIFPNFLLFFMILGSDWASKYLLHCPTVLLLGDIPIPHILSQIQTFYTMKNATKYNTHKNC